MSLEFPFLHNRWMRFSYHSDEFLFIVYECVVLEM